MFGDYENIMVEKDLENIRTQISHIDNLKLLSPYDNEFKLWHEKTEMLIMEIFGGHSHQRQAFQSIIYTPLFLSCRCSDTVFSDAYLEGLKEAGKLLESFAGMVK